MAGIAGVVESDVAVDAAKLEAAVGRVAAVQRHRAPAGGRVVGSGKFFRFAGPGDAPQGADLQLSFDGEITNRSEVRNELRKLGTELQSEDDQELILAAWRQWKDRCAERLDGRFAFVLHDATSGETWLVRDRFSHLPIHYTFDRGRLWFASETKALLAVDGAPELNELALLEWSLYGDVLPPRTLFKGVHAVPPGHVVRVEGGRVVESRTYYHPSHVVSPERYAQNAARPMSELLDMVDKTTEAAVLSHMGSHDNVALMLSGGVDSAVIAAMAVKKAKVRGYNFSVSGDARLDERPMAREVAKKLGIPLETMVVDGAMYRRELANATYAYETPLWHMQGVPLYVLARRAREDGVSMLLSGVTVGPLLGAATDRYRWILPPPGLSRVPSGAFRVVRKAVYTASGLPIANPFFIRNLAVGLQFVDGGARSRVVDRADRTYGFLEDLKERRIHVMRLVDNELFLQRFFHQGDRLCMSSSIEYCDAAVNADFVSMALNMPTSAIFHEGKTPKWVLKEVATRYIPREIAFQKKIPLDVPIDEYFSRPFQARLFNGGFLESYFGLDWSTAERLAAKAKERAQMLFQLVNVETWGRIFLLQQSPDEVRELLSS